VDTVGNWNVRDFEFVWVNKISIASLYKFKPGCRAVGFKQRTINSMQAHFNHVKQSVQDGVCGFIGPFNEYYLKADGTVAALEIHIFYLGKTEDGYPAFLAIIEDITAREYQGKIETSNDTDENSSAWEMLSIREREVGKFICEGLVTKTIAEKLGISRRTVDNHRANIRKKFNLSRTASLADYLSNRPTR
jgi:DNA-binding CsgD family transcriptional regulator